MLNITHYQRNANQNHSEVPFTPVRMAATQKSTTMNAGEGVEEREGRSRQGKRREERKEESKGILQKNK